MNPETLRQLMNDCIQVARHFRLGMDTVANGLLLDVITGISEAFAQGLLDAQAAQPVLTEMLSAKERRDVLLVADILEHIFAPSIASLLAGAPS